eukprot:scaffold123748_cov32-Tisochrysis_lutea.AAC.3
MASPMHAFCLLGNVCLMIPYNYFQLLLVISAYSFSGLVCGSAPSFSSKRERESGNSPSSSSASVSASESLLLLSPDASAVVVGSVL